MADSQIKQALSAELERARAGLAHNITALRADLDFPRHLKSSLRRNKTAYIGGAAILGILLSKLPARKKKVYVERKGGDRVREAEKAGLWIGLLQLAFKAARPALVSLAADQIARFAGHRSGKSDGRR